MPGNERKQNVRKESEAMVSQLNWLINTTLAFVCVVQLFSELCNIMIYAAKENYSNSG